MIIQYSSSVKVPAGWRHIAITAKATRISPGLATVDKVLLIDGQEPKHGMSRTGAARQAYSGLYISEREVGTRKRLSACRVEEHEE
jgi:hypothetical protein